MANVFFGLDQSNRASVTASGSQKPFRVNTISEQEIRYLLSEPSAGCFSAAIGHMLCKFLSPRNGVLLHAAHLVEKNGSYLFLGSSGAGKTTVSKQATGFECVNDDKVAVIKASNHWVAFGVPMYGSERKPGKNINAPLRSLYFLRKSKTTKMTPLSQRSVFARLCQQTIIPLKDHVVRKEIFETLFDISAQVPALLLDFPKDFDARRIIGV